MKTDEQIFDEWCKEMEWKIPSKNVMEQILPLIKKCRENNPEINSGIDLIDYLFEDDEEE